MDSPADLLNPSSEESFGCHSSSARRLHAFLDPDDFVQRCSPMSWDNSRDPRLDAGGGHVYEGMVPPVSPPEGGREHSTLPKLGTWIVGSDGGRASSSSAAANTAAAAAKQEGATAAATANPGRKSTTLMQQMREQLRRSQQSSSQQSTATEEGYFEERRKQVGESMPARALSSAPLPRPVMDRTSVGRSDPRAVTTGVDRASVGRGDPRSVLTEEGGEGELAEERGEGVLPKVDRTSVGRGDLSAVLAEVGGEGELAEERGEGVLAEMDSTSVGRGDPSAVLAEEGGEGELPEEREEGVLAEMDSTSVGHGDPIVMHAGEGGDGELAEEGGEGVLAKEGGEGVLAHDGQKVLAQERWELPVAPAGDSALKPKAGQDHHHEASGANEAMQQSSFDASAPVAPQAHASLQASQSKPKLPASRLPQVLPPSATAPTATTIPSTSASTISSTTAAAAAATPQQHHHSLHGSQAAAPQAHTSLQALLESPQKLQASGPPQLLPTSDQPQPLPQPHQQHPRSATAPAATIPPTTTAATTTASAAATDTPQQSLTRPHDQRPCSLHDYPAPRPAVRNLSPGRSPAGSTTHKRIPGKANRVAQNLALFGQTPRSPSAHVSPPPPLQQQVAQQQQQQEQQQQQIEVIADEPSQPVEELGDRRDVGCLDPAISAPAPAPSQRPDLQQQHPHSEGGSAVQTAPHSRASSSAEDFARLSEASTASNSIINSNSQSAADVRHLEGMRVHEGPAAPSASLTAADVPAPLIAQTARTAMHLSHASTHGPKRCTLSNSSSGSARASDHAHRPASQSPGGRPLVRSPGGVAAPAAVRSRSAKSDAASAGAAGAAASTEGLPFFAAPHRSRSPDAMATTLARARVHRGPRPRDWDKSVHVQPLPLTKARFVYELQMQEMASQREQEQSIGGLSKPPPPPKSIKEPPDDREERLQLMYYREVATRKMQEKRIEQARQEHEQAQLQDCTFVPSISKMSAWITRHNLPAGRACLSQGQSLGSPGRGFTSPRPVAGSPGKSHRSSSAGGGGASTRTTPPRGPLRPSNQVLDQEQSEAGQSTISLTSTERQERQVVFDRLYRQAAASEQRRQQRLEDETKERQRHMFRARSPGTDRIASNHYMVPKSGPNPNLLPTGMDQCTFRPRTNFARHVHANPRPNPEAEQLRAFDDDDFYTAALGISVPPSPARLAGFHSLGRPGGGGAVLAQRRQSASITVMGSPGSKNPADASIRGSSETEGGTSGGIVSNAPNALHSISDKLDWDEFLSRQYAFLSQQILRSMEESGAPASPPKPILSSGSAKIMQRRELEGEHYVPPYQRPLSPGRSDLSVGTAGKASSASSHASMASHKLTAMAARLPSRTVAQLMEGGRELKEAKLAGLRRQLEEQEKAATPFKPTNFSTKDRYPEVKPRVSRHDPGQHLVAYAQQQLALEERRIRVQAEREAAEMAECTFHPRTNPLPAYLWKAHQWDVEQLAGPEFDLEQLEQGESEAWEGLEEAGGFWPKGDVDMQNEAAGGVEGSWLGYEYGDPATNWEREAEMSGRHLYRPKGQPGHDGSSMASSSLSSIQMSKPAYDLPDHTYPRLVHRQLQQEQQQQQQQQHNSRSSSRSGFSGTGLYASNTPEMWHPRAPTDTSQQAQDMHPLQHDPGSAHPQQQAHKGSQLGHQRRTYLPLPEEYVSDEDAGVGYGCMDAFKHQLHRSGEDALVNPQQQQQQQQHYQLQHQQQHQQQHLRQRQRQQRPSLQDLPDLLEVGEQQQQPHRGQRVPEAEQTAVQLPLPDGFEEPGIMPSPLPLLPGTHSQPSMHSHPQQRPQQQRPQQQQNEQDGSVHSIRLSLPPEQDGRAAAHGHAPIGAHHHAATPLSGVPLSAQHHCATVPQNGLPPDGGKMVSGSLPAQMGPTSDLDLYKEQLAQMQAQLLGS